MERGRETEEREEREVERYKGGMRRERELERYGEGVERER